MYLSGRYLTTAQLPLSVYADKMRAVNRAVDGAGRCGGGTPSPVAPRPSSWPSAAPFGAPRTDKNAR